MRELVVLFSNSVPMVAYASIFAAGMVFILFSLVFGGDDADDGDVGDDAEEGSRSGGPGVFSIRGVSILSAGFGGSAFISHYLYPQVLVSSAVGLGFGFVFAFVCMFMIRLLISQQSSSIVSNAGIVGKVGVVTTTIPKGGKGAFVAYGEAAFTVDGVPRSVMVISTGQHAIAAGERVKAVQYFGGSILVEPV